MFRHMLFGVSYIHVFYIFVFALVQRKGALEIELSSSSSSSSSLLLLLVLLSSSAAVALLLVLLVLSSLLVLLSFSAEC